MTGYISKKDLMEYCSNSIDRTIDLNDIARFPISDVVERKKGKWEMVWNTFFHTELPRCTACKNSEVYKTNFCPNCGADMMEDKDDAKVRG